VASRAYVIGLVEHDSVPLCRRLFWSAIHDDSKTDIAHEIVNICLSLTAREHQSIGPTHVNMR